MVFPRRNRKNTSILGLLLLLSISYWYCLPAVTQSILSYSEFRFYDFLMAYLIFVMVTKHRPQLRMLLKRDKAFDFLWKLCIWATATYPLTLGLSILNKRFETIAVTLIFLFHLWGFVIAYAAFRIFLRTRKQCLLFLDLFLVAGAIEGVIICLQSIDIVPRLWGSLYDVYGELAFSGTLGPNRQLPGHMMLLTFGVAASYWRNLRIVGSKRLILSFVVALISLAGLGVSGSRTAWIAFIVYLLIAFIFYRPQLGPIAFVLITASVLVFFTPDSIKERVEQMYDYKVTGRLETAAADDAYSKFRSVDSGRSRIWIDTVAELVSRPWIIPFGAGFNTFHQNIKADTSAHNVYLNLIAELGLVGLYLYLSWLWWIWRESSSLISKGSQTSMGHRATFLPHDLRALLIAIMVSLTSGEILYPYRPSFAFMGSFLFLCAVLNHRALAFGKVAPISRRQRKAAPALLAPALGLGNLKPMSVPQTCAVNNRHRIASDE